MSTKAHEKLSCDVFDLYHGFIWIHTVWSAEFLFVGREVKNLF